MRANEFITEAKLVDYEGIRLKVTKNDYELMVDALDDWGNNVLGHVTFYIGDDKELDPQDLWVNEKYQRQGIAKTMYDYVKKLGYTIVRSYDQTDAGSAFWDKHRGENVRVWEAFDKPYKGKWEKSDYGDIDVNAKLPDGTYLNIMFTQEYDGEGDEVIQVEFYRNNSQEVTGEGDAQRIFATVLNAIQKYIKKYKPQKLSFSANKSVDMDADDNGVKFNPESRAKLYTRLVQRYASDWGYQAQIDDEGDVVIYQLTRDQGVAEGLEQITEYRNRLFQYVKSLLPTWPDYVLKDWLVPNKGNFSNLPADALKNSVMEKVQGAGLTTNSKWQLIPDMKFTMDMFDPKTKQLLIGRAGGSSDLGMGIPKDKERHATQAALAQQQGGVRKEPVLLIKTAKGYELLEGWHRTIQHFAMYPQGYTGPAYVAVQGN